MRLYTETTDGSFIEDKETSLVWCYEDADHDFGSCQAKELINHLESVLANAPVSVKSGSNNVEVKPQVSNYFWFMTLTYSFGLCLTKLVLKLFYKIPFAGREQGSCGSTVDFDHEGERTFTRFCSLYW